MDLRSSSLTGYASTVRLTPSAAAPTSEWTAKPTLAPSPASTGGSWPPPDQAPSTRGPHTPTPARSASPSTPPRSSALAEPTASSRPTASPAATGRRSSARGSAQHPRPGRRGTVYLTFDDGPSAYTPAILDILSSTGSTATFFELGVRRHELPGLPARILRQGSSIGNHTYDHRNLTRLSVPGVEQELAGGPQVRCARPPYGATDATVRRTLAAQGYREVLWTTDTLDWTRPGVPSIVARATAPDVGDGSIVLLHDGGGRREQTVAALPLLIRTLQSRSLRVRRLPGC